MTNERFTAIRAMIVEHTKAATVDRKTARSVLIKEGIYTADGKLTPQYGGKETKAA